MAGRAWLVVLVALALGVASAGPALAAPPQAFDGSTTTSYDTPVDVFLDASDADLDFLTYEIVTPPSDGSLDDCSGGFCTYTPDQGFVGEDSFTWRAVDAEGPSNTATFTITVEAPPVGIYSAGPLEDIVTSADLNCAVNHTGDTEGAFFGDTACGTFLVVDGTLYSPASVPAGGTAVGEPWTPVSQGPVTGTGTAGDPYTLVTTVAAGTTGVTLTQTDTYVVGQESFRTEVTVDNAGPASTSLRLYRAADCYLADSDSGLGAVDAASGAVACTSPVSDRILQWQPLSPGSHYYEAGYSAVWGVIGAKQPFPDTCECDVEQDNGAGLSWDLTVPAGGSATRASLITFSPTGALPLSTTKTVDLDTVAAGDQVTYTVTVDNPGSAPAALTSVIDTLPAGFAYVAGSTSGITTADPGIAAGTLTWPVSSNVPAGGSASLTFSATASDVVGTWFNNATATATDLFVNPTGDTAPVTVEEVAVTVEPVTDLQVTGSGPTAALLTWVNPAQLDGIVVRYSAEGPPAGPTDGTDVPVAGTPESVEVTGLTEGTTYWFSVFATLEGQTSTPETVQLAPYSCPDLTPALDAGDLVTGQSWVACSAPDAHDPASALDTLLPVTGGTQALMTNGDRAVAAPPDESTGEGRDNGTGSRGAYDVSIYKIDIAVPQGASCLSLDYVFASEEYPEYVGQSFNDGFLAQLDQYQWVVNEDSSITATDNFARLAGGGFISVNSPVFADPAKVAGPATNGTAYDGMSVVLTASTPVTPGNHSVYLSIFDAGDGILDSAVLLDGLRTSAGDCVVGSNQPPVAVDDEASGDAGTAIGVNVLANDTDGDGDTLELLGHSQGSNGSVTCTLATGACTYTPEPGWSGTDTFTYTVGDAKGGTDTATVTVTVVPVDVNQTPVAVADSTTTPEDTPKPIDVLANDTDGDGDPLTVQVQGQPGHGTVVCTATCTYTPDADFHGEDSFSYRVGDGTATSGTVTVTISVTPVNDAPVAQADSATTPYGVPVDVDVVGNDGDVDGDPLTASLLAGPAHGTVVCTGGGCTYTPDDGWSGQDSFTYTVSDGQGGSDTATVTVTTEAEQTVDVSLTKADAADPVAVGASTSYDLVVRNISEVDATGVVVTDDLPAGFVVRTASAGCTTAGGTVTCQVGALAAGASRTLTVLGAHTVAGQVENTATVVAEGDSDPGNDTASVVTTVTGRTCTIVGTFGNDNPLLGTNGPDVICGLGGNDRVNAKGGDDTIYGNEGDDRLMGLGGNDLVDGGPGSDTVTYAAALQAVKVDLGKRRGTGQGTDTFVSIENVEGSRFADRIIGNALANVLSGLGGNDWVSGLAGADTLGGGDGRDRLDGGRGRDRLLGGRGADSCSSGGGGGVLRSC